MKIVKTIRKQRPKVHLLEDDQHMVDVRGKLFSEVRPLLTQGRERLYYSSRAEALKKAVEIAEFLRTHGEGTLKTIGQMVNLTDIRWCNAQLQSWNKTIRDAVTHYVEWLAREKAADESRTIDSLLDEWFTARKGDRNNPLRHRSLTSLNTFRRRASLMLGSFHILKFTKKDGVAFCNEIEGGQLSKKHFLNKLNQFLNWCVEMGYLESNPMGRFRIGYKPEAPKVFSLIQTREIVEQCLEQRFLPLLPYILLQAFGGVRPAELAKFDREVNQYVFLQWADVDLTRGYITVPTVMAKRFERTFKMEANLLAWLKWWKARFPNKPLIQKVNLNDSERRFRGRLRFDWLHDGLRHTYASHWLGVYGSYEQLCTNMGNTLYVAKRHYVKHQTKEDGESYFAIHPPARRVSLESAAVSP